MVITWPGRILCDYGTGDRAYYLETSAIARGTRGFSVARSEVNRHSISGRETQRAKLGCEPLFSRPLMAIFSTGSNQRPPYFYGLSGITYFRPGLCLRRGSLYTKLSLARDGKHNESPVTQITPRQLNYDNRTQSGALVVSHLIKWKRWMTSGGN